MCWGDGGAGLRSREQRLWGHGCTALTQAKALAYLAFQRGLLVAQEGDLEVGADQLPADAPLAGVLLDVLQHRAGLTQQLLACHQDEPR